MEEKREQTNQTSAEKMRGVRKRSGAGGTPARRVARVAVLVALAMILSYVETLIPVNFGVPGIKLGLANLVVVTALAILHPGEAFLISAIRILLGWEADETGRLQSIETYASVIEKSAAMNFTLWPMRQSSENIARCGKTFRANIEYLTGFISKRYDFLESKWGSQEE